jgi:hypothetical protein
MALVTLEQAKAHLRQPSDAENTDIDLRIDIASAIVVTYMTSSAVAGWSDGSVEVPGNVQAAVLCVIEDLYERRPINWDVVRTLLVTLRDPALA